MGYQNGSDPMLQQVLLAQNGDNQAPSQPAHSIGGIRPLSEQEIKGAVEKEIVDSLGAYGSSIHEQRRVNIRRYLGKALGNEVEGQSQAQMSTVADTVEWILPSVMKSVFGAGSNIWDFAPTKPGEEFAAEQASDSVNHVFIHECNGYEKIHSMAKTGLLEKRGYLAAYYDERYEPQSETYRGLTDEWIGLLMSDPNLEVTALEKHDGEIHINQMGIPEEVFDVTVKRTTKRGQIRVDAIAPEHMLLPRRETELNDETRFSGYRKKMTVSELISLGYDPNVVSLLQPDSRAEFSDGHIERLYDENAFPTNTQDRTDGASRELWVNFIWMRLDEDGDGYAELRNIVCVGDSGITILEDREVSHNPLVSFCPIPMPHKFFGTCPADQAVDLQVIESTVLRQILDNMYRINNGRYAAVEGQVNMKDLVENKAGGIVRMSAPGMVQPLTTPALPGTGFEVLNFMKSVGERRTGVSSWQQGPDAADMKYQTSGAVSNVATASESRTSLINRIFAETGLKELGKKIFQLMCENYTQPFTFLLRGQWVQCDPRSWNAGMSCTVESGQGVGETEAKMGKLMAVKEFQKEMLSAGLRNMVTPRNLHNTAKEFEKLIGIGAPGYFFTHPGDEPWPQPQPDFGEQVKFKESDRRALEDQNQDNQATLSLAVQSSSNDTMERYRYAELAHKERMESARLQNQQEVAKIQIEGQIRSAMQSRQ
jgi:hypothetical protein